MNWLQRKLSGSLSFRIFGRRVTIYGFNAMHGAIDISTRRWGWVCFQPPFWMHGKWWPWKFYVSPNGTPGCSTFAIGPGIDRRDKEGAPYRRQLLGHNYRVDDWHYPDLLNLDHKMYLRLKEETAI